MTIMGVDISCRKCPTDIWRHNRVVVLGSGPTPARLMFIGEAPGRTEDLQGKPFVGQAGKVLNDILRQAGLKRREIYITNIVKCRPTDEKGDNRPPTKEEITTCSAYLETEIKQVNPLLICSLGGSALSYFLPQTKISAVHGRTQQWDDGYGKTRMLIPLYHPAVAIYNRSMLPTLVKDMVLVKNIMQRHEP